jgi:hypothetical protein
MVQSFHLGQVMYGLMIGVDHRSREACGPLPGASDLTQVGGQGTIREGGFLEEGRGASASTQKGDQVCICDSAQWPSRS